MLDSLARYLRKRLKPAGAPRKDPPSPGPTLNVAAVAENRSPYAEEIVFLFKSLLLFGGHVANFPRIAYFIDAIDGDTAEELAKLGVVLKVVQTLVPSCPHANKLHALLDEEDEADMTVALDTDVVVARDFSQWLGKAAFAAKPADMNPISGDRWPKLLERLGAPLPPARYLTHHRAAPSPPYYNSGVLLVRKDVRRTLALGWRETIDRVSQVLPTEPDLAGHAFYTDQIALAAALARLDIEQLALPLDMNFPTHIQIDPVFHPHHCRPYLLHHHHRFDERGTLLGCGYDRPDEALKQISQALQVPIDVTRAEQHAQVEFDNAAFWDKRYRTDFDRGSGLGSRGRYKDLKIQWIRRVLDGRNIDSVLDVGCGDLVVVGDMDFKTYTGVDVSAEAVTRNQARRPDWKFIAGNFL